MSGTITWKIDYSGIEKAFQQIKDFAVFTVEPPWQKCSELFVNAPKQVFLVQELEQRTLDEYVNSLREVEYVVGVGGGTAVDAAKYVALRRKLRFITVPTVVSVNAYLTARAAVRNNGIVNYIGDKFPELVVVDLSVIRGAPSRLNRAGVGDVYSTRTALMDWKVARDRLQERYDLDTVNKAEDVLRRLVSSAKDIRDVTEVGVKNLVALQADITALQWPYLQKGKKWPEEGTEHVFFYSLEKTTGRAFIHGETVGTGSVVSTYMHRGDVSAVIKELDSFGLKFRPADNAITHQEFEETISNMKHVANEMKMHFPVLEDYRFTGDDVRELWRLLS
jgi:glycerol-1-phosphate dehydrogenase [NAD(P)+]